jgi:hypothetical protein
MEMEPNAKDAMPAYEHRFKEMPIVNDTSPASKLSQELIEVRVYFQRLQHATFRIQLQVKVNYFTSSDPHHDIYLLLLTYLLAFYLAYLLAYLLTSYLAFYLANLLAFYLANILNFIWHTL